jgi:phospholipase/lecithinase/hemolysin
MTDTLPARLRSLVRRCTLTVLAAGLLASCGGGTSQIEPFIASRYIALGDELSAFAPDGRKYAVNGLAADGVTRDCSVAPLWTQVVAALYGFGFAECPVGTGEQKAITRAAPGARVADIATQVAAQTAAGGFTDKDLVTVLVGVNDIKALYQQSLAPQSRSEADLLADARALGDTIAAQVNSLVSLGAKVIVSTVPDVGLTPYAKAQGAAAATLMSNLSAALNGRIRVGILNDGRFVGLILADEFVQTAVRVPGLFSFVDAATPACAVALPDCTTQTLVTGANAENWLWADDTWFTTAGHRRLGALAEARAQLNPF